MAYYTAIKKYDTKKKKMWYSPCTNVKKFPKTEMQKAKYKTVHIVYNLFYIKGKER